MCVIMWHGGKDYYHSAAKRPTAPKTRHMRRVHPHQSDVTGLVPNAKRKNLLRSMRSPPERQNHTVVMTNREPTSNWKHHFFNGGNGVIDNCSDDVMESVMLFNDPSIFMNGSELRSHRQARNGRIDISDFWEFHWKRTGTNSGVASPIDEASNKQLAGQAIPPKIQTDANRRSQLEIDAIKAFKKHHR